MTNVDELRKAADCIYLACAESVACDISSKLRWAADKIEQLTAERNAALAELSEVIERS